MQSLCGFLMAMADSVPGISGGTIAFIMGYYDQFIGALHSLTSGSKEEKRQTLLFILKLGIGWVIGFVAAVLILTSLFQSHIYMVSSLFMGFVFFSVPLVLSEEKNTLRGKWQWCIFALLGAAIVLAITIFSPSVPSEAASLNMNIGTLLYVMIAGMVAISAMVLPGISGSTLLLVFGLYVPVMNSIKNLLHFDFSGFLIVMFFGIGVVIGILLALHFVRKALEKFRAQMIFFIMGMMIASLYSIVVGPATLDVPKDPVSWETFSILMFLVGGAVIGVLQGVKKVLSKKK